MNKISNEHFIEATVFAGPGNCHLGHFSNCRSLIDRQLHVFVYVIDQVLETFKKYLNGKLQASNGRNAA